MEYLYFPDPEGLGVGVASFTWNADAPEQDIELTSPDDSSNTVYLLGYVLHEIK
jgi:hypothetical protein